MRVRPRVWSPCTRGPEPWSLKGSEEQRVCSQLDHPPYDAPERGSVALAVLGELLDAAEIRADRALDETEGWYAWREVETLREARDRIAAAEARL
jgi:hypothetical protein